MQFINKLCVCDKYVMWTDDISNCGSMVQEPIREHRKIIDSKRWEPTDSKKNSKDEPLLLKASAVAIEDPVNNTVEKFYFKSQHNWKDNNYGVG